MLKKEFDALAAALGSPYAAVNYIAKSARKKLKESNNGILESQAISWVLTGKEPKVHRRMPVYNSSLNIPYVDEVLCYVDDEEVCESVRESYNESLLAHHLIYCYHNNLDEFRKSRVRILTRMIWYNIQQEGGFI